MRSLREAQNESLKATQKVEVNGSAKVSVDVKAPPGTKAKAEGAGSLKDIELKRTPHMEPADSSAGQFPG